MRIFRIELAPAATEKGFDGRFTEGPLANQTVNIKWYPKREGLVDLDINELAEYYLVLTGPRAGAASSRGTTRPWRIDAAYLFDARAARCAAAAERQDRRGVECPKCAMGCGRDLPSPAIRCSRSPTRNGASWRCSPGSDVGSAHSSGVGFWLASVCNGWRLASV